MNFEKMIGFGVAGNFAGQMHKKSVRKKIGEMPVKGSPLNYYLFPLLLRGAKSINIALPVSINGIIN